MRPVAGAHRPSLAILLVVAMCSGSSLAYSVLTHEEIVDLLWSDEIRPLLLKRFPGLTDDQIKEAHAYAYGGAVIQDWVITRSAIWNSATWRTTFAAEASFASSCANAMT